MGPKRKPPDSILCRCGALTAIGNIGKDGTPILFVGAAYKHGHSKTSTDGAQKRCCLWCGRDWPANIQAALAGALP